MPETSPARAAMSASTPTTKQLNQPKLASSAAGLRSECGAGPFARAGRHDYAKNTALLCWSTIGATFGRRSRRTSA